MNTIIQSDGFELTDALRDHVKNKLKKLERFNPTSVRCLLKQDHHDNVVELMVNEGFLKVKCEDMYSAVTRVVEIQSEILASAKD